MKKVVFLFLFFFAFCTLDVCASDIFSCRADINKLGTQMPQFENTVCKFEQNKYISQTGVNLKSGGNFEFIKNKGITFETLYPIHSQVSYNASDNKNINAVVKSVINKDFSRLEKNFDFFMKKNNQTDWQLTLKPKAGFALEGDMDYLLIEGKTINTKGIITKITIALKSTVTTINFSQCRY